MKNCCDVHARQQTIAMVDTETREFTEKTLRHEGNAVREFYGAGGGGHRSHRCNAVVLGIAGRVEYRMSSGTSGKIRAAETRKPKHDRRDARVLDLLMMEGRFPEIWMPSMEQRDLRTLSRDRHQWVKMRARLQHTLQAIALNHALRHGHALWSAVGQSALLRRHPLLPPQIRHPWTYPESPA